MADAGTVTLAEFDSVSMTVKKITFSWTSSAGGAADKQTAQLYSGELLHVNTIPGTGGSQPTSYTATLLDDDGVDVLAGGGAGRSTTATEQLTKANLGVICNSHLYLHVTGAGATKAGQLIVYVR